MRCACTSAHCAPGELAAIFAAGTRDLPNKITSAHVARQSLLIAIRGARCTRWSWDGVPGNYRGARAAGHLGTIEALKTAVEFSLGMSNVPDVAAAERGPRLIVRPPAAAGFLHADRASQQASRAGPPPRAHDPAGAAPGRRRFASCRPRQVAGRHGRLFEACQVPHGTK